MTTKQRKDRIDALKNGELQGLCNCEIATYGLDIPAVEAIIMLRHTFSLALFFQMVGRGLRLFPGKDEAIILDHVNNLLTHFHPLTPYEWNFFGAEKNKKRKIENEEILKLCPKCFIYFTGSVCDNCGAGRKKLRQKTIDEIDGQLQEQKGPVPLGDRPYEEKKEFHDRISKSKTDYHESIINGKIDYSAIRGMVDIAEELGYAVMWCYHQLNNLEKVVNVPLLYAIAKVKSYKSGWVHFKKRELQGKISKNN